jgi:hypothetical protein
MTNAIVERGPAARQRTVARAAPGRQPEWTPTLAGDDLACLLRVIESELLPRLVDACASTHATPLRTDGD